MIPYMIKNNFMTNNLIENKNKFITNNIKFNFNYSAFIVYLRINEFLKTTLSLKQIIIIYYFVLCQSNFILSRGSNFLKKIYILTILKQFKLVWVELIE